MSIVIAGWNRAVLACATIVLLAAPARAQQAPASPYLRVDPSKIQVREPIGARPCGECHRQEAAVWQTSAHAKGFDAMHRKPEARKFLDTLGLRVTKRQEALCMRCHYTVGPDSIAVAGVSCESCHGAAGDWLNVHNKFASGVKDGSDEPSAAREARLTAARARGMLTPSVDIYGVAANCFDCHLVPVEKLVNVTDHPYGPRDFDLVEKMGLVRHNYLRGKNNPEMSVERKRVIFVVGRILAYEYAIRGLAEASDEGEYGRAALNRVTDAFEKLQELSRVQLGAVTATIAAAKNVERRPGNKTALLAVAEKIRLIGRQFGTYPEIPSIAALDKAMAGGDSAPADEPAATVPGKATDSKAATPGATTPGAATATRNTSSTAPGSSASAATPAAEAPDAPPKRRRPEWFLAAWRTKYANEDCTRCHKTAGQQLPKTRHHNTGDVRLGGGDSKALAIANLYGLSVAEMRQPSNICMGCHGAVDESRRSATRPDSPGLICETCHGAATRWFAEHKNGKNPRDGMRPLKQAGDRAELCAGCHRVSDARLVSAGHPTGEKFDVAERLSKIRHWPDEKVEEKRREGVSPAYKGASDTEVATAYAAIAARRTIPPKVPLVALATTAAPETSVASPAAGDTSTAKASGESAAAGPASRPFQRLGAPPALRVTAPPRSITPVTLSLEPLPSTRGMMAEEILLLVKRRLAAVDAALGRRN